MGIDDALAGRQHLQRRSDVTTQCGPQMRYLHTMVRISNIEQSLAFYCGLLGLTEVRRIDNSGGRFTLIFLAAPGDADRAKSEHAPLLELTYNWDPEAYESARNFGHLAFEVDDIYATCNRLQDGGVAIARPPRDGRMAFVRSPDLISIELLQKGSAKKPRRTLEIHAQSRPLVGDAGSPCPPLNPRPHQTFPESRS